ncbi:hypothetical protein Nepgr_005828 [Nepenthes gracilis]|uniref:Uncharacterized protein n=1 Tax=Nepenthes gracilis TaxID=150966 RepID=A0AAD3XGR6_NEPGR|nr:hypothetical protein Nepgr_005828 [Nepenthes gracilis]
MEETKQQRMRGRPKKLATKTSTVDQGKTRSKALKDIDETPVEESTSHGGEGEASMEEQMATSSEKQKDTANNIQRRKGTPRRAPLI